MSEETTSNEPVERNLAEARFAIAAHNNRLCLLQDVQIDDDNQAFAQLYYFDEMESYRRVVPAGEVGVLTEEVYSEIYENLTNPQLQYERVTDSE